MTTYQFENTDYEIKIPSNNRDYEISDLKTRLFDLEQQEKDNNALIQKLNQLKREFAVLSETKKKLEQELKKKR